ncbi:MAG: hypothetical protein ABIT04_06165 [Novosphingobium sp.]
MTGVGETAASRRSERALHWLRNAVVLGFVAAVLLGIFLPVYTDEVGWRFQERAGIDGVDKMFSDRCGPNAIVRPPWFMMPVRTFSAALNLTFAAPLYVRLAGILHALLWAALLWVLIHRITREPARRAALGAIGFGLLCLANTPLLMVLSRPEQPLILCTMAGILLAFPARQSAPKTLSATPHWAPSLGIVLLTAIALSYHLKGLFLAPVFLAALALCTGGRAPRAIAALAVIAMTAAAGLYWLHRLECPGDAILRAEYARNSAGMRLADLGGLGDFAGFAAGLLRNINPFDYIALARPERYPLSDWLPPGQVSALASALWEAALFLTWGLVLALALIAAVAAAREAWRTRHLPAGLVLAGSLVVAVSGASATRLVRNFYEASFVLPLLALAALLALASPRARTRDAPLRWIAGVVGCAGLTSLVLTCAIWRPALWAAWHETGYVDAQEHSFSIRGFTAAERDILGAARLCRLPPPERARAVLLDDVTYFPYMAARLPQHWLGVFGTWRGSIDKPIAYLESRRSDGVLVSCHLLPPDLRARAHRQGEYCCLTPPGW